jgi:molecular chaperone GrpE
LAKKDKTMPDTTAGEPADAPAPADTEAAEAPETPEATESEEFSSPEKTVEPRSSSKQKVSRKDLFERMAEKNELAADLAKKIDDLEAKLKETNDKWLRTAADFENYRKRTRKEWELLKHQSKAEVVLEILGILDDFERAFSAAEESESSGLVEGFRLIYGNLTQTLERLGVKELDALHQPFDPNFHMAVGQAENDDLDSGVVAEVVQKGYLLNDTVIRPANVLVAK